MDCNSNTYTGLRWGVAFIFLLIQWIALPYRAVKMLFVKRFELDRDVPTILNQGGCFLEYKVPEKYSLEDEYFFWDCVKYFIKALCIIIVVTLFKWRMYSLLTCMAVLLIYIIALVRLQPYK